MIDQLCDLLLRLHCLCSFSSDAGADLPRREEAARAIEVFGAAVRAQFAAAERERLLSRTVPCMARYALSLRELRPCAGFRFSLRGIPSSDVLDRRFVASLVACAFFSLFPYRCRKKADILRCIV